MSESKRKVEGDINPSDVKEFLRKNPDFLIENPDLFSVLTPPNRSSGNEVVDFQNLMIEKIKGNLEDLKYNQGRLITTSRNNLTTQAQVHEAVLSLLDIESMADLGHVVTQDWADNLHIDVIRICFEVDHQTAVPAINEITYIPGGCVDDYLGKNNVIRLRGNVEASEEIFGPARSLVKAEALIKIPETEHNPPGILAFGSRDAEMFYPGQGTELLRFLSNSFHKCLIQWIKQEN